MLEYAKANPDKVAALRSRRHAERRKTDPGYVLATTLRKRLNVALKQRNKSGSAVRDLGCSIAELREHLEGQFYPRTTGEQMTWENYGRSGWHIDHIQPLVLVDHGKDVVSLCHYTNLQPLWCEDNLAKRDEDLQRLAAG